jgi:hypothetical protein
MFTVGRAITSCGLDDLRSARNELKALQAVVDVLLERKGN